MTDMILLTEKQAAQLLSVGDKCLQAWRVRGGGPPYHKVGRLIRYREGDLLSWLESRRRQTTSEAIYTK